MEVINHDNQFVYLKVALLKSSERSNQPTQGSIRGMVTFQEMVEACEFLDDGYQGHPFT